MRKLSGPEWFAKYRKPDEGHYEAIERLARESGLGLKTVYRAVVHCLRVAPESVDALEKLAGEGRLDRDSFLSAPTGQSRRKPKVAASDAAEQPRRTGTER